MRRLAVRQSRTPNLGVRAVLVNALKGATPSLKDLAREAGLSYSAVRMYIRGKRTPSRDAIGRIAKALRARGRRMAQLADELERGASAPPTRTRRKS